MATTPAPQANALPSRAATFYASGSFTGNLISRVAAVWIFYFYAHSADGGPRVPLWLLGGIITATGLISAFDDMLVGYWSDRTRSRCACGAQRRHG